MRKVFSFMFALIGAYSIYLWGVAQAFEYKAPTYIELTRDSGKARLEKPWKTAPYISFITNGGVALEMSCGGPYGKRYWCKEIENLPDAGSICSMAWMRDARGNRSFVFEMTCGQTVVVDFPTQLARFSDAYSEGPPIGHLLLGIGALVASLLVLLATKEKG